MGGVFAGKGGENARHAEFRRVDDPALDGIEVQVRFISFPARKRDWFYLKAEMHEQTSPQVVQHFTIMFHPVTHFTLVTIPLR